MCIFKNNAQTSDHIHILTRNSVRVLSPYSLRLGLPLLESVFRLELHADFWGCVNAGVSFSLTVDL
jgi:hypothetical protein